MVRRLYAYPQIRFDLSGRFRESSDALPLGGAFDPNGHKPVVLLTLSLEASRGNRLEALYVLAVTAGLRIGKLLGLNWEDIDLDAGSLHVRRTRSQAKTGPTFTAPKNDKGRSIRLTQRAVEVLKTHKATQNAEGLKA